MDNFYIHLKEEVRRFPTKTRISTVGMIPQKIDTIHKKFPSINFSLILKGSGFYSMGDQKWEVKAPCIITQHPQHLVHYGPEPVWSELFIIYDAEIAPIFETMGIYNEKNPIWYLSDGALLQQAYQLSYNYFKSSMTTRCADIFDREIEAILVKSLYQRMEERKDSIFEKMKIFESQMLQAIHIDHSMERFCQQNNLNAQTFRRAWAKYHDSPPHQYLLQQRIFSACRLLVESNEPIGSIAQSIGFEDALYFSRQFKKHMQCTPKDYRTNHQNFLNPLIQAQE